jgi:hypothetical protein
MVPIVINKLKNFVLYVRDVERLLKIIATTNREMPKTQSYLAS